LKKKIGSKKNIRLIYSFLIIEVRRRCLFDCFTYVRNEEGVS